MAWEWVAPTATGAVGLAGIVTTYLSGREGRIAAEKAGDQQRALQLTERARLERREAYAEYLAALNSAQMDIVLMRPAPPGQSEVTTRPVIERLLPPYMRVSLLGSEQVRYQARVANDYYGVAMMTAIQGTPADGAALTTRINELLTVMRDDFPDATADSPRTEGPA